MELKKPNKEVVQKEDYGVGLYKDGVFRFTNATNEDFVTLWNNKEYTFPKMSTCPMIIPNEPPENIQNIRKYFAKRLAQREFHKSKEFNKMDAMGRGLPPTYNEKILDSLIQQCLEPLPSDLPKVKDLPKTNDSNFKASKAVSKNGNLNEIFKDDIE